MLQKHKLVRMLLLIYFVVMQSINEFTVPKIWKCYLYHILKKDIGITLLYKFSNYSYECFGNVVFLNYPVRTSVQNSLSIKIKK